MTNPPIDTYFGDSLTEGDLPSGARNLTYPWAVSSAAGRYANVLAIAGSNTADQAPYIYGYTPQPGSRTFIMLGCNDRIMRGDSVADQAIYSGSLGALLYWLAGSPQPAASSASWSFPAGTWNAPEAYGIGKYTAENGAQAQVTFSGDIFTLGYLLYDSGLGPVLGSFTVTIDGVEKGSFCEVPPAKIAAGPNNVPYIPALARIAGCGPGEHTALITVTGPEGSYVFLDWAGAGGTNGVPTYLLTIPRCAPTYGLPIPLNYPTQDESVAVYNAIIDDLAAQAVADGLTNVSLIDTVPWLNPACDLGPDGLHPTQQGQMNLAACVIAALNEMCRPR